MKSISKPSDPLHKSKTAPDMRAICRRRLACVDEIESLRGENGGSAFVERARSLLLPRYWQNANWRTRSEILDSVEWLLRLSRSARAEQTRASV